MTKITIGSVSVGNGEKINGTFKIGEFPDSSPIQVPFMVVNGKGDGPTLWVQSAIHGDEICGTFAIQKIINKLDPADLNGVFIGVPAVNITAFWNRTRGSPFEKFGNPDMNRVFPGNPNGTLTEQFAHAIFTQIKTHANYLIDFHTGDGCRAQWTIYPKMDNESSRKSETLAKYFGFPIILPLVADALATSLFTVAVREVGIPSIIIEVGSSDTTYDDEMVDLCVRGIQNVMRYLKMIPGESRFAERYQILTDWTWMRVTKGGVFQNFVRENEKVSRGQHIATIFNIYGEEREKVVAPVDGIILTANLHPLVFTGDTIYQIGIVSEESK